MNASAAAQFGLVFHLYGLIFFALGAIALTAGRWVEAGRLGTHLGWLAAFGLLYGLLAFVEIERLGAPSPWLTLSSAVLLLSSSGALLEFGRRLWNDFTGRRRLAALPLYSIAGLGVLGLAIASGAGLAGLEFGSRYLLSLPGAALAAAGLAALAGAMALGPDTRSIILWLRIAAVAMLGFALLALFLSPEAALIVPGMLPAGDAFLARTGLPIELFRAASAALIAIAVVVFNIRTSSITTHTLRRVTDHLNGFVYRCRNDRDWSVTFMSEGCETLTGYRAEAFRRGEAHFAALIHPEDQKRVWEEVQDALAERSGFQLEYRIVDRHGVSRWCYEEGRGVFGPQGELLYLEGYVRDDGARRHAESARRQLATLVEASPQCVGWADPNGTVRYLNTSLRELLGVAADADVSAYHLRDFFADESWRVIESTVLPSVMARGHWTGELDLRSLQGHRIPVLHSVFALRDEGNGQVAAIANVVTDLRELQQISEELKLSEMRLRSMFELSPVGIALNDFKTGAFVDVNDALLRPTGYTREEFLALSYWDVTPAEYEAEEALQLQSLAETGGYGPYRKEYIRKDGSRYPVLLRGMLVRDPDGRQLIWSVIEDLIEQDAARAALQRERDFAASLLDTAPVIILLLDPDGMIRHVNAYFEHLTGFTLAEVTGREWFATCLPARDQERIRALFNTAVQDQPVRGNVNAIVTRDGEEREIEWHAVPLRGADGQLNGLLSVGMDVTERQRLAQELREFTRSLEQRVVERTVELERANAAKSEFLSRMSHELRTPLNAILGFAQLLELSREEPLSHAQAENVAEIQHAGKHLLALVNEILDLARIESGVLALQCESVALRELVERCVVQIAPDAAKRSLTVTLDACPSLAVSADPTRLRQVLLNLLSNAVKYNRAAGRIEVSCAPTDTGHVRITVRDTGRGLNAEQRACLFRPFERLESAYEGVEGVGIGLALAKQLVEAMRGQIGVDSVPGEGSTFWFELPRSDEDASVTEHAGEGKRRHTVLCVEDNPANLRLVERILARREDIRLLGAGSAEDGMVIIARERPDLILLDINLPGMDGFDMLARLQEDPATRGIPVIAITANAMARDVQRGKAAGFADYLTKPLQMSRLLAAIDECLAAEQGHC